MKKIIPHTKKSDNNIDESDIKNNQQDDLMEKKSNSKKVIVVHGWDGDISRGWFPWLKENLESEGFNVVMQRMPNPEIPQIEEWITELKRVSGNIDEKTYFIGHSIGCQTILRMLEKHESEKAGGAIFLAGWFNLKEDSFKEDPISEPQSWAIAKPWIETKIDFDILQKKL
ncbi:MAG: RBBP9/YdeN family alpha/beta hydrolase, partial [Candidatus Woesearchaeota archaeon]